MSGAALDVRVGELLRKRNMRIGDVIHDWDDDGDGQIDRSEFLRHLHSLGLTDVTRAESDKLFSSLDEDGSGELDMHELRHALKNLLEAATRAEAEGKAQNKLVGERRRVAAAAQNLALQVLQVTSQPVTQQVEKPQRRPECESMPD